MSCKVSSPGPGVTVFTCGRQPERAPCETANCGKPHEALCDYPVKRNGKPATCDRRLCSACRVRQGPDIDHCPAHARLKKDSP